jgi:uncharacterized membrane protein
MTWYELLLFLHIVAAIVWLGSGLLLQILAFRAERGGDVEGLRRAAVDGAGLSQVLFIPASLSVFVLGVLLVIDGPWAFDQLWITLGLAGYLATFVTGVAVIKPSSEKIAAMMERDGGMSPASEVETRRLLVKGRFDTLVLYLVVAVMVLKPTSDDVGLLVVMAAIIVAGAALVVQKLRAIDEDAAQPAPASA